MDPVFDTRATSDVLIAAAKKDPGSAARYQMADYRSWLISHFQGGAAGLTVALPRGIASGSRGGRTPARPVPLFAPRLQSISRAVTCTSSFIRIRSSVTDAAQTSRGCR